MLGLLFSSLSLNINELEEDEDEDVLVDVDELPESSSDDELDALSVELDSIRCRFMLGCSFVDEARFRKFCKLFADELLLLLPFDDPFEDAIALAD